MNSFDTLLFLYFSFTCLDDSKDLHDFTKLLCFFFCYSLSLLYSLQMLNLVFNICVLKIRFEFFNGEKIVLTALFHNIGFNVFTQTNVKENKKKEILI